MAKTKKLALGESAWVQWYGTLVPVRAPNVNALLAVDTAKSRTGEMSGFFAPGGMMRTGQQPLQLHLPTGMLFPNTWSKQRARVQITLVLLDPLKPPKSARPRAKVLKRPKPKRKRR